MAEEDLNELLTNLQDYWEASCRFRLNPFIQSPFEALCQSTTLRASVIVQLITSLVGKQNLQCFCQGGKDDAEEDKSQHNDKHANEFFCHGLWVDVPIPAMFPRVRKKFWRGRRSLRIQLSAPIVN